MRFCGYKVGAINFTTYSTILIKDLKNRGKKIFLDLKYHDIPNTVKEAVFAASTIGGIYNNTLQWVH